VDINVEMNKKFRLLLKLNSAGKLILICNYLFFLEAYFLLFSVFVLNSVKVFVTLYVSFLSRMKNVCNFCLIFIRNFIKFRKFYC